jgi:hypothetical protein
MQNIKKGVKISFEYKKGDSNDCIQIVIDGITKKNLIEILIGDEIDKKFSEWLNEHGHIFKYFYEKYNYTHNDKRFAQQDHIILFQNNESTFSITMFGENTVNFVSLIGTSKIKDGVIKKVIIPKLKVLGYEDLDSGVPE